MNTPINERGSLKGRFPFRLGATSFVIPDDIIPNVRRVADLVDDVEILFFEDADKASLPSQATIKDLARIASDEALSYTVHLPLDLGVGSLTEATRRRSVAQALHMIELVAPLSPLRYIVHFPDETGKAEPCPEMRQWHAALTRSMSAILKSGVPTRALCIETLSYPFEIIKEILVEHDLGICLDVGHLLLAGRSPEVHFDRYADRIEVIHLHAVIDGKDHHALSAMDTGMVSVMMRKLSARDMRDCVVTLEVFKEEYLRQSLSIMGELAK